MLKINNKGQIFSFSDFDDKLVLLTDLDIKNSLFDAFNLDDDFTFKSFFEMLKNYPSITSFFPVIQSYLDEYLILKEIDELSDKIAVITPVHTVHLGIMDSYNKLEVYIWGDEANFVDEDISSMYLKEYINYKLNINTLTLFENVDENNTIDGVYFENHNETVFDLLNFVKFVIENISLHGFVEERNQLIDEVEKEIQERNESIEEESKEIAKNIMKQITFGDKK